MPIIGDSRDYRDSQTRLKIITYKRLSGSGMKKAECGETHPAIPHFAGGAHHRRTMANTRRESTALQGSENTSYSAGLILIPAMGLRPHLSTSIPDIRQGINNLSLPVCAEMISCIASAIDTAFALHTTTLKGSTVSLIHGSVADTKLFAVSPYPERSVELCEVPSWDQLFDFALANIGHLLKPGHALGTWFNDYELMHVLDVVVCLSNRDEALDLAKRNRQLAIFDIQSRREISVSSPSETLLVSLPGGDNA